MKNKTMISFFSGGGGFDIGAQMAGFTPVSAYEYIPEIAAVYKQNLGDHVHCMSILDVIIKLIKDALLFHFSPPCPNFSNAKQLQELYKILEIIERIMNLVYYQARPETKIGESFNDVLLSRVIREIIREKKPIYVTLENVWGYRKSGSFLNIYYCLLDMGYDVGVYHLNAADYGTPQTRKRLILIARRDGKKARHPTPTHEKDPNVGTVGGGKGMMKLGLFNLKKWVGWYEAIEDLIPTLERSKFAPWQLKKLPKWFGKGSFIAQPDNSSTFKTRTGDEPINTIPASMINKIPMHRAFIMNAANPNGNETRKYREGDEPMKTITSGDSVGIKGYIPQSNSRETTSINGVMGADPVYTIRAGKAPEKALIIPGGNASSAQARGSGQPAQTIGDVSRVGNIPRAFVMDGENANLTHRPNWTQYRDEGEVFRTTTTGNGYRAYTPTPPPGRVVKLSIRALARLQSFPDSYQFPTQTKKIKCVINGQQMYRYIETVKKSLSCTIIGNSVPPLLSKAICDTLN